MKKTASINDVSHTEGNLGGTSGSIKNAALPVSARRRPDVKRLVFTALMAALSVALSEFLSFKVPVMPSFISFDFSDVPALLAALTMGPLSGLAVCLIKNIEGLLTTMTGGVGELSNFILGACLVVPSGIIAQKTHKRSSVVIACLCGAAAMALASVASNYFVVYPIYTALMPMDVIIGMYQAILPGADTLLKCLVFFNMPFTLVKGLVAVIVSVPLYKRLRPVFNTYYGE